MVDLCKVIVKHRKRILSVLLVWALIFSICGQFSYASEVGTKNQINNVNNSQTVTESVYNPDIVTPNEYALWKESIKPSNIENKKVFSALSASYINNNYIRNEYIEAYIASNGLYTMGTTGGNPNSAADDNKNMLYGHPSPWSSITTMRVDGQNYEFSANVQPPITTEDGNVNTTTQKINDIEIKQILTFFENPNTGRDDIIEIKYQITNTGR